MPVDPTYSLFTPSLIIVSAVFPTFATIVVGLRFYVKRIKKQAFYYDDWTILVSLALCRGMSLGLWIMASRIGVTRVKMPPQEAALETFKFLWVNEIPFSIVLGLVKISILLFYARLFAITILRKAAWALSIIIALWTIAVLLVKTNALSGIWTDPTHAYAIEDATYSIVVASMSLSFDVIILLMPLFVIRKLQMALSRKIAVMLILWLGALCCVAAGARLHLLNKALRSAADKSNAYADLSTAFVWAELEPNASVVAASLPMLRPLFLGDEDGRRAVVAIWWNNVARLFGGKDGKESSVGDSGAFVLRVYTKTESETGSTRGSNGINDLVVHHDVELGSYQASGQK